MSSPAPPSALRPEGSSLTGPFLISVVLHGGAFVAAVVVRFVGRGLLAVLAFVFPWCRADPPPLVADLEVAVVSLPKSETSVPDRASRARRPRPAPKPTPTTKPEPAPVKQSDLVHKTEEAPKEEGTADDTLSREDLIAEIQRQNLLDEILADAPEGTQDQLPTDPDGTGDEVVGSLSGVVGDAELSSWQARAGALFRSRFNPLGGADDTVAKARIELDCQSGRVTQANLTEKSGVLGFDAAAERALAQVTEVPLPPDKYRTPPCWFVVEFTKSD